MSMILFAYVVRVGDGLPLSASTDSLHSKDLQECKRYLKILSKILGAYPGRGTVKSNQLQIHFNSLQGVAYMTICCSFYPTTLAFCFLEELGVEFVSSYDHTKVHMVSRPYAFLEFDSVIQKIKWHYNYSNRPSLKISVGNIQQELKVNPPRQVNVEDIVVTNGTLNGQLHFYSGSAPRHRLEPVSAVGILSIVLNIMCGALNLIRGVHLIEHLSQDDDDRKGNIIAFLTAFLTCLIQCYLFLFYISARTAKALTAFVIVCLCNLYLFGHRNAWQVLFHIGVASLSSHQTLSRKLYERPPELGV
ncbi:vesicle-trafficking protein SEC22c [Callorhinchus milii]|uniref:Longin domain-containing protein n=1 Tax=Callorhinchus milii TaxID=7868 RepID=A0A4W3HTN9_CALMI|nr:vesicle-trafficking protein SEC22c [Callorhinchus milii]XP_042187932.1 vesicle-trafficking protein SEC22c [Callorhinchus milii]|eukprot:gi/632979395/ref/XP_007906445.1/ PREDICTED: vesicle-trafficking protein SEC22c [Callorhinchus milii]